MLVVTSGSNFDSNNPLRQCSFCGGGSVGGDICPWCGEKFNDPLVIKLGELAQEVNEIDQKRRQLITDRDSLLGQIVRRKSQLSSQYQTLPPSGDQSPSYFSNVYHQTQGYVPDPRIAPPIPRQANIETKDEISSYGIRNFMLIVGVLLFGGGALAFVGYSWHYMGVGFKAAAISVFIVAAQLGALLTAKKLKASSQAFAVLAQILILVASYQVKQFKTFQSYNGWIWFGIVFLILTVLSAANLKVSIKSAWHSGIIFSTFAAILLLAPLTNYLRNSATSSILFSVLATTFALLYERTGLTSVKKSLQPTVILIGSILYLIAVGYLINLSRFDSNTKASVLIALCLVLLALPLIVISTVITSVREEKEAIYLSKVVYELLIGVAIIVLFNKAIPHIYLGAISVGIGISAFIVSRFQKSFIPNIIVGFFFTVTGLLVTLQTSLGSLLFPLSWLSKPLSVSATTNALNSISTSNHPLPWLLPSIISWAVAGIGLVALSLNFKSQSWSLKRRHYFILVYLVSIPLIAELSLYSGNSVGGQAALNSLIFMVLAGLLIKLSNTAIGKIEDSLTINDVFLMMTGYICLAESWSIQSLATATSVFGVATVVTLLIYVLKKPQRIISGSLVGAQILFETFFISRLTTGTIYPDLIVVQIAAALMLLVPSSFKSLKLKEIIGLESSALISQAFVAILLLSDSKPLLSAVAFSISVTSLLGANLLRRRDEYLIGGAAASFISGIIFGAIKLNIFFISFVCIQAIVLIGIGLIVRAQMKNVNKEIKQANSWIVLSQGMFLLLLSVLGQDLRIRSMVWLSVTIGVSILSIIFGVIVKSQCSVVVGGISLLVSVIQVLIPIVERSPKWIPITISGALLIWIGFTFDRRLTQFKSFRVLFRDWN